MENVGGLGGLEVFIQTAQTQSFTAAGRILGISASAVSKSISRLEDRTGVRLFQRSTRSICLTSEGEMFLERCRRIIQEVRAAEDDLSAMAQQPRGRLKVGLAFSAGLPLPVLAAFMEAYPQIELDLDFTDRLVDVIDEGFDVVIRGSTLEDSRLVSRQLGSWRASVVASPAYLAAKGTPGRPKDLLNHACLHYRWPTTGKLYRWPLQDPPSVSAGIALPITMVCSNLDAILYLAIAGRGIACLPDFSVRKALEEGRLISLMDGQASADHPLYVVWPSNRQLTPKVRSFVDFVCAHVGQHLEVN